MVSGVSDSSGFAPRFITSVRSIPSAKIHAPAHAPAETENVPDLAAPPGDQDQLTHEFTMLDLASRQFARILPEIESVTAPVE